MEDVIEDERMAWFALVVEAICSRNARQMSYLLPYGAEKQWSIWDYKYAPDEPFQHKVIGPLDTLEKILVGGRNWSCLRAVVMNDNTHLNFGGVDGFWEAIEMLWDAGGKHKRDAESAIQAMASGAWDGTEKNGTGFTAFHHSCRADLNEQYFASYDAVASSDGSVNPLFRKLIKAHNQHFIKIAKGEADSIQASTQAVVSRVIDLVGEEFTLEDAADWICNFFRSGLLVSLMSGHYKSIVPCIAVRYSLGISKNENKEPLAMLHGLDDICQCIHSGLFKPDSKLLGTAIEDAAFELSEQFDIADMNTVFKEMEDARFQSIDDDVRRGLNRRFTDNERKAIVGECAEFEESADPIAMPQAMAERPQRQPLRM